MLCHSPKGVHASQRFRLEQYLEFLENEKHTVTLSPFFSKTATSYLYQSGNTFRKVGATLAGFTKRFLDLFKMASYDYVHVIREAMPLGPPVVEWFAAKVLGKKLIYEFDDAVWMKATSVNDSIPRNKTKVASICKWAHKVVGGNDFLLAYAKKHNDNTTYIPTTIDTANHHRTLKKHNAEKPVTIGWTGTFSNLPFLEIVMPALRKINSEQPIKFLVICNAPPGQKDDFIEHIEWKAKTEIKDLLRIDIGLMPLEHNEWAKGKCGFKILQYLSLGIPALASPVGVNAEIIDEGLNGFLCSSEAEWENALRTLVSDYKKRSEMGIAGREKVKANFSVTNWKKAYLDLYQD